MFKKKNIWLDMSFSKMNENCGIAEYEKTYFNVLKNDSNLKYFYNPFCKSPRFRGILYFLWINTYFYIKTLIFKPDIIIFSAFDMPYFVRTKTKYFVVFHDLIPLRDEYRTSYIMSKFQFLIDIAKKNAYKIITVSNTIKKQLIEHYDISPDQIRVVYNSVGEIFKENIERATLYKNLQKQKYIFFVSGAYPHKNLISLIKGFDLLSDKCPDIKLVISGYSGSLTLESSNKNILFTGYVSDLELASLYKNALLFVFPSKEEGFGRPAIEAQYANIPLVCSNIPVFREVAGAGAEFCEPTPQSIAEKIQYLLNNSERREELIRLGQNNIRRFDFEKISEQLKDAIEL